MIIYTLFQGRHELPANLGAIRTDFNFTTKKVVKSEHWVSALTELYNGEIVYLIVTGLTPALTEFLSVIDKNARLILLHYHNATKEYWQQPMFECILAKKVTTYTNADDCPMCSASEKDEVFENISYDYIIPDGYVPSVESFYPIMCYPIICDGEIIAHYELGEYVFVAWGQTFNTEEEIPDIDNSMCVKVIKNSRQHEFNLQNQIEALESDLPNIIC